MHMCKIMIEMNNHLKVLSETDTSLSDRIFPKPQFMTPL